MPIPSMTGLQTALRGLEASQEAIDTTGHNIANANTPGYSRQTVNLTESQSMTLYGTSTTGGQPSQLGTGVDASSISRVRDQFLDGQYRTQNTMQGNASTTATALDQTQTAFDEPSDTGLSAQMGQVYSDWSAVANDPTSTAARQALVDDATTMSQSFNQVDQQLATAQSDASQQFTSITGPNGQVQADATQIAALNGSISKAQAAGQDPNDLEDQRDNLLDSLSSLGTVSVTDPGNGLLQVSFGDAATPLVNGTAVNWPQTITSASGGQLGALLNLASPSGPIGQYRSSLDTVANDLITSVNALQPSSPFFSGNSAGTIAVAATPGSIQAGSSSAPGANDLATSIAQLQGGATDQAYAGLIAKVGGDTQAAETKQTNSAAMVGAVNTQRESISGVSLDEEMTNLMSYQRGYEASARMMTTMDSLLNTLINQVGAGV